MAKTKSKITHFLLPTYTGLSLLDQFADKGKTLGEIVPLSTTVTMKVFSKTGYSLLDSEQFNMYYRWDPDFHYSLPVHDSSYGSFISDWPMLNYRVEFIRDVNDPYILITNTSRNIVLKLKPPTSAVPGNKTVCVRPLFLNQAQLVRYEFSWEEILTP